LVHSFFHSFRLDLSLCAIMKRDREDASTSHAERTKVTLAREIAAARAESLARRKSTWLDAEGEAGPGGRRTEINFPASTEEYKQLLLESSGSGGLTKETLEKKLRKGGEGEGDAGDDEAEWNVAAVIVPEHGTAEGEGEKAKPVASGTWVQSYDTDSDAFYYFHSETHETTWDRPDGVEIIPDEPAAEKIAEDEKKAAEEKKAARARAFAEARTDADVTREALVALKKHTSVDVTQVKLPSIKSWYYEDDSGNWQGPFTAAQLMGWRSMLPMELRLFEHGNEESVTTLADVLGDRPLISQCAALGIVLPPRSTAAHAQYALREGRSESALPEEDGDAQPVAPQSDWAQAVMDGLPPEQAIIRGADPAEIARKVLERREAVAQNQYAASGVYNKFLNKIMDESKVSKPTSVYGDIGLDRYVDTTTFEQALYEMKNRKHVKLTAKQIAKLKERKRKLKDKFNNEWLRKDD